MKSDFEVRMVVEVTVLADSALHAVSLAEEIVRADEHCQVVEVLDHVIELGPVDPGDPAWREDLSGCEVEESENG